MKTIKIIDLFVKIANGEEVPKKIRYYGNIYYESEYNNLLITDIQNSNQLNDEVEIIKEEKKLPEKWNDLSFTTMIKKGDSIDNDINRLKGYIRAIMRTQNEIIDYLKSKEKGE